MNLFDLLNGPHAAIRLTQRLKSSAGDGSKIYPPTFEGGVYCFEKRRLGDASVPCVLLDGVASSANRQEESIAAHVESGKIQVPHFRTELAEFPDLGEPALDPSRRGGEGYRYGLAFERLRDRSDAHLEETGTRPTVLVAGLGSQAETTGRVTFISNLLAAGGIAGVGVG